MTRIVQITPTSTIFVSSSGPFVSIPTSSWIAVRRGDGTSASQPYADLLHAVQDLIRLWMEGSITVEHLVERLEHHQMQPKVT